MYYTHIFDDLALENEIKKQLFVFSLEKWQSKTDWNNNFFANKHIIQWKKNGQ